MNKLKSILHDKIEEWIYEQIWDGKEEVAPEISSTNAVFTEIYCENIKIKEINQVDTYHFESKIIMYGEPRKDDVSFYGDTINILVEGTVIIHDNNPDNLTIICEQIDAQVQDWIDPIPFNKEIPPVDKLYTIKERKFNTKDKDIGKLLHILSKFPPHFWFRGQLDESWKLKPSIARIKTPSLLLEKNLRAEFQNQITFLDSVKPLSDDIEKITFLMQHHKVPTRLLDWTTSPLIALYFAVYKLNHTEHDKDACIWVLDPKALNETYKKSFPLVLEKEGVKTLYESDKNPHIKSLAIHAPYNDLRMRMQKSEFTIHTTYENMEDYNSGFLKEKIIISKDIKDEILKRMEHLGIDHPFLFPDPDNIGLGVTQKILNRKQ